MNDLLFYIIKNLHVTQNETVYMTQILNVQLITSELDANFALRLGHILWYLVTYLSNYIPFKKLKLNADFVSPFATKIFIEKVVKMSISLLTQKELIQLQFIRKITKMTMQTTSMQMLCQHCLQLLKTYLDDCDGAMLEITMMLYANVAWSWRFSTIIFKFTKT